MSSILLIAFDISHHIHCWVVRTRHGAAPYYILLLHCNGPGYYAQYDMEYSVGGNGDNVIKAVKIKD